MFFLNKLFKLFLENNLKAKYLSIWNNDFNPFYLWFFEKYMDYPNFTNDIEKFQELVKMMDINTIVISKELIDRYYSQEFINKLYEQYALYNDIDNFLIFKA